MNNHAEGYSGIYGSNPIELLKKLQMLDYALCEKSFSQFFKAAWHILEPTTPRLDNWHQEAIAEYLEACLAGDITRLIINMPPRYSKSLLVTVMFPAWCWLKQPSLKFINASYAEDLAVKHAVDRRILMQSSWYQAAWGNRFQFSAEQNQKSEYINDMRGSMVATGMLGAVTGKGGDFVIIDDPHNPKKAESDAERKSAVEAFDSTFTTRLDNKKTGRIIVVMQRLHFKDLTGHLLDKKAQGEHWDQLKLPIEAPHRTIITLPMTKRKIVREPGAILHPEREGKKEIAKMKVSLGSMNYAGQYEQNPTPRVGNLFKKSYWRYYLTLPEKFDEIIQSWDMTFKDGSQNDLVAGFVMGRKDANIYLIDCVNERLSFGKSKDAVKNMTRKYPLAIKKAIENKANGPAIENDLRTKIPGIVLVEPEGSKMERAALIEPYCEAGNIYLPSPNSNYYQPWVQDFINQAAGFPKSEHDDMVDAFTQGVKLLSKNLLAKLIALGQL